MAGQLISSLGLILDIIGALLIWKFGLPPSVSRGGIVTIRRVDTNTQEADKAKLYDKRSHLGVGLLSLGFLLQLIGLWLP